MRIATKRTRVFLAIDLSDAAWKASVAWAGALAERIGEAGRKRIKWVETTNLHITLNFFGELTDERLADVQRVLSEPFASAPFAMALAHPGTFPATGSVRIIWLGAQETDKPGALQQVFDDIQGRMKPLRLQDPSPEIAPHITIGRVRHPGGPFSRVLRSAILATKIPPPSPNFLVSHLTLYESRPLPAGPVYYPIARYALQG